MPIGILLWVLSSYFIRNNVQIYIKIGRMVNVFGKIRIVQYINIP